MANGRTPNQTQFFRLTWVFIEYARVGGRPQPQRKILDPQSKTTILMVFKHLARKTPENQNFQLWQSFFNSAIKTCPPHPYPI